MLTNKRLKWGMVVVVLAGAGATLVGLAQREAAAGEKWASNVYISTSQRYAYGSLGTARNSSSNIENIGCSIWTAGTYDEVTCTAKMSGSGTASASCSTFDQDIAEAARAINGDSWLEFDWDANGECTELFVSQASRLAPKAP